MIAIDEISNEDINRYFDDTENVSYLAYQFEISAKQDAVRTARENVKIIGEIIDKYFKGDRYRCLRRVGGFPKKPLQSDSNVMVGFLIYECNLDIKTNTIYRRY